MSETVTIPKAKLKLILEKLKELRTVLRGERHES
jgi:hypothetical protein